MKSLIDFLDQELNQQISKRARITRFVDRWYPSSEPEPIFFFRGDYKTRVRTITGKVITQDTPFYVFYQAYIPPTVNGRNGGFVICTCHDGLIDVPCLLHDMLKKDLAEKRQRGDLSRSVYKPSRYFAFNILRLSYFHEIDVEKELSSGVTRVVKQVTKCLEYEPEPAPDTMCPHCKKGAKRWFGQRAFVVLSKSQFDTLLDIDHLLGKWCRCGGKIITLAYKCPACQAILVDGEHVPHVEEDFWKKPMTCFACGRDIRPVPEIRCRKCTEPKPLTIFDVPVKLHVAGNDKYKTLQYHLPEVPIPMDFVPEVKQKMEPYDFKQLFMTTTSEQAQILGIQDPYSAPEEVEEEEPLEFSF